MDIRLESLEDVTKKDKMKVQSVLSRPPASATFEEVKINKIEEFLDAVKMGQNTIHRKNMIDAARILVIGKYDFAMIARLPEFRLVAFNLLDPSSRDLFEDATKVGILNNTMAVYLSDYEFPLGKALLICEGRGIEMILRGDREMPVIDVRMATDPLYFKGEASWWGFIDFSKALEVQSG